MGNIDCRARMAPIWALFDEHRIMEVTVRYSGSGDSGQAEDAMVSEMEEGATETSNVLHRHVLKVMQNRAVWVEEETRFKDMVVEVEVTPAVELMCIAEEVVYANWPGWENNEGGFGTVRFQRQDYRISVSHAYYVTNEDYAEVDASPTVLEQMAMVAHAKGGSDVSIPE